MAQKLTAGLVQLTMLWCLIGLIRSGRWRLSYGFVLYVCVILVLSPLQTWLPGWNTWGYWQTKQIVYDAVKLVLAMELAWRVSEGFPGARRTTQRWVLAVLIVTAGGMILRPWNADWLLDMTGELHARAVIGTLWVFAATVIGIRHFRVVTRPFYWGLICGFAAYLAVWGFVLRLMQAFGWAAYDFGNALNPPAYALFSAWLAWVAWRPDSQDAKDYKHVMTTLRERSA